MISVTEIILIAAGILAVILGYLIPNGSGSSDVDLDGVEQKINDMVSRSIKNSQGKIDEMLDDCMEEAISKAERAMDRVTNDKMTAISDYSDTVMNDIHKNHDEVVFMYDMLNDKHKNLKNTVSEANRAAREVKEAEAKRLAEQEAEAKRKEQLEEEAKKKAQLEEEARKKAQREAEARRLAELEAEAKRKAELEEQSRRKAQQEAEAKREAQLEEEARRRAELEELANRQAELETAENVQSFDTYENGQSFAANQNEQLVAETDVVSEPEFSSLVDIIDRADAAAAKKTKNKVIRSEQPAEAYGQEEYMTEQDDTELQTSYWPEADEDDFIEEPEEDTSAKVVSIADAPRKKAVVQEEEVVSDPVSRNQKILDMHKAGKSAVVIARELRLGIGEVKLVIDLAGKHKKNRTSIM